MPTPRSLLCAAELGGEIYAIGGRETGVVFPVDTVEIYDPSMNSWSTGVSMPTGRGVMGIAVLVLSQVDRRLEEREYKMPRLRDLLGPPVLEQRADLVLMLYRKEYYDLDDVAQRGLADVWVAKNRSGPMKRFTMAFLPEYRLFADLGRFVD